MILNRRPRRLGTADFFYVMKKAILSFVAFALTATGLAAASGPGLLVPAYFPPGDDGLWPRLNAAAEKKVPLIAIMNPDVGPGRAPNPEYLKTTKELKKSGGKVVGYIFTKYGLRNTQHVMEDISNYFEWYPDLDGIFIDQMPSAADFVKLDNKKPSPYLGRFYNLGGSKSRKANKGDSARNKMKEYYYRIWLHINALNSDWLIIGNPGAMPDQKFFNAKNVNVFVTFANYEGYDALKAPAWLKQGDKKTAHLVYDIATAEDMKKHIAAAKAHGVDWIYVSDDGGGNPWDTLPAYWDDLVAELSSGGRSSSKSAPSKKKRSGFFRRKK